MWLLAAVGTWLIVPGNPFSVSYIFFQCSRMAKEKTNHFVLFKMGFEWWTLRPGALMSLRHTKKSLNKWGRHPMQKKRPSIIYKSIITKHTQKIIWM